MYKMIGYIKSSDGQWLSISDSNILVKDYGELQECMKTVGVQYFIITLVEVEGEEVNG